jgi:hypothetical protein
MRTTDCRVEAICRVEAQRRRMTVLIRNAHGIAEWKLFLNDKAQP